MGKLNVGCDTQLVPAACGGHLGVRDLGGEVWQLPGVFTDGFGCDLSLTLAWYSP